MKRKRSQTPLVQTAAMYVCVHRTGPIAALLGVSALLSATVRVPLRAQRRDAIGQTNERGGFIRKAIGGEMQFAFEECFLFRLQFHWCHLCHSEAIAPTVARTLLTTRPWRCQPATSSHDCAVEVGEVNLAHAHSLAHNLAPNKLESALQSVCRTEHRARRRARRAPFGSGPQLRNHSPMCAFVSVCVIGLVGRQTAPRQSESMSECNRNRVSLSARGSLCTGGSARVSIAAQCVSLYSICSVSPSVRPSVRAPTRRCL